MKRIKGVGSGRRQEERTKNSEASHENQKDDGPRIFVKSSLFADSVQINHSVSFSLFLGRVKPQSVLLVT